MFGFVCASVSELDDAQKRRYNAVYCGICRRIRIQHGNLPRLTLRYDMAFLAMLHMSLYEPQEQEGDRACMAHPVKKRPWVDCDSIGYAADMNVALAYYKCLDDWRDEKKPAAWALAKALRKRMKKLEQQYPRQCTAIRECITELSRLEQSGADVDATAGCFGTLMAELLVYREDFWAERLRQIGFSLGRFIYIADAVVDLPKDRKKGRFNPLPGDDPALWEEYLVMAMGRCTREYEKLPLVQDKQILDNILYSGVWVSLRRSRGKENKG